MLNNRKIFISVVVLLTAALFVYQIKDRAQIWWIFQRLEVLSVKKGNETRAILQDRAGQISDFFVPFLHIGVKAGALWGDYSTNEIKEKVAHAQQFFQNMEVSFYDPVFQYIESDSARVVITARFVGLAVTNEPAAVNAELDCYLRRINNHWQFVHIEEIEVWRKF